MTIIDRRRFVGNAALLATASAFLSTSRAAASAADLTGLSIAEAARRLRARDLTSVALVTALLSRIDRLNPALHAYITVMGQSALQQAAVLDLEAAQGRFRGPLHGIPLAIKDNIDTAGTRTTAGSLLFDDRVPTADAFVVTQLRRAGAILLGKANLHEFAMGGTSATSYFGSVHNPWALDRVAGGSSGGSAAVVSAGLALGAIGTDTGGSIRIPAAWCGVVGLKPTYGLVSLQGIFPLIYSLDHCGPITRTVQDAATMLSAMVGYDKDDVASVDHPAEDYAATMQQVAVADLRVGVPCAPFFDKLEPSVASSVEAAILVIRGLVKSVQDVTLPATGDLDWTAIRAAEVEAVHEDFYRRHADSYSLQTRGVLAGTEKELNDPGQTSAEKLAALVRANWQLTRLRKRIDDAFTAFDLVVLPTNRTGPGLVKDELRREETSPVAEPQNPFNSLAFDLYGIPAISVPCGFTKEGLPIGLMIAGPHFSERAVLALSYRYQEATEWHKHVPSL